MLYEVITQWLQLVDQVGNANRLVTGIALADKIVPGRPELFVPRKQTRISVQQGAIGLVADGRHRITSYNVCYTKLLRI